MNRRQKQTGDAIYKKLSQRYGYRLYDSNPAAVEGMRSIIRSEVKAEYGSWFSFFFPWIINAIVEYILQRFIEPDVDPEPSV